MRYFDRYVPDDIHVFGVTLPREQCLAWIAAMRSGKYRQGRGLLYSVACDTYCANGLLAGITGDLSEGGAGRAYVKPGLEELFDHELTLGAVESGDRVCYGSTEIIIANANDDGASFAEIADWVERYVLPACPHSDKQDGGEEAR